MSFTPGAYRVAAAEYRMVFGGKIREYKLNLGKDSCRTDWLPRGLMTERRYGLGERRC
jgi:hypothetical protein